MPETSPELPDKAWRKVWRTTSVLTALSAAMSVSLTGAILKTFGLPMIAPALVCAVAAPIVLAGPLLFIMTLQKERLRAANTRLAALASTDSLTDCLNRGAFISRVTPMLAGAAPGAMPAGALLIIDADNFKSINDSYGHDCGDEALRTMAAAIRGAVRDCDIVGRIGGEEFGVFLRGAKRPSAERAAERIRLAISAAGFTPRGEPHGLSASIGGAVFHAPTQYKDLYRIADHRLYAAKRSGRNRWVIVDAANDDARGPSRRQGT